MQQQKVIITFVALRSTWGKKRLTAEKELNYSYDFNKYKPKCENTETFIGKKKNRADNVVGGVEIVVRVGDGRGGDRKHDVELVHAFALGQIRLNERDGGQYRLILQRWTSPRSRWARGQGEQLGAQLDAKGFRWETSKRSLAQSTAWPA